MTPISPAPAGYFDRYWIPPENRERSRLAHLPFLRAEAILPEDHADPIAGLRVLEVGPGEGRSSRKLARRGARVCAVDLCAVRLRRSIPPGSAVDLCGGMGERLPLRDSCIDLAIVQSTAMHLNLPAFLREIRRVLRPEGRLIALEPLPYHPLVALYRVALSPGRLSGARYLTRRDIAAMTKRFARARVSYHGLVSAIIPSRATTALDRRLMGALPWLRRLAWFVLIVAEAPRRSPEPFAGDRPA